jgi:hypothetical protein
MKSSPAIASGSQLQVSFGLRETIPEISFLDMNNRKNL